MTGLVYHLTPGFLRWMETRGRFSLIFDKEDNLCDFLLAFLYIKPLLKRVYSKRKELTPFGETMKQYK